MRICGRYIRNSIRSGNELVKLDNIKNKSILSFRVQCQLTTGKTKKGFTHAFDSDSGRCFSPRADRIRRHRANRVASAVAFRHLAQQSPRGDRSVQQPSAMRADPCGLAGGCVLKLPRNSVLAGLNETPPNGSHPTRWAASFC